MIKTVNSWIRYLAYVYLTLPILIFIIGWIKLPIAIIGAILIIIALFRCIFNEKDANETFWTSKDIAKFGVIFCIISLWVYLSGIGGLCYQNGDHMTRNMIYQALVEYDWPVISPDGSRALIYYIGFWLPSALVGKLCGMSIGYWFQAVWSVLGIFFTYYFICMRRRKVEYWPLFLFIFFSGMDYMGAWLLGREAASIIQPEHLEWWSEKWQFSSMTTQLFWVYNQAIPAWLATMLVLTQKNKKNLFFILSLLILSSTFTFVGLIPIVLYFALKKRENKRSLWENLSFQNLVGVFAVGILSVAFLMSNRQVSVSLADAQQTEVHQVEMKQAGAQKSQTTVDTITEEMKYDNESEVGNSSIDFSAMLLRYLLFALIEYLPYAFLVQKSNSADILFYILIGILLICPLISLGDSVDFCMRASIPALFCLMLYCIDFLDKELATRNYMLLIPMIILLLIGSITSFNEIHRSVKNTIIFSEEGLDYTQNTIPNEAIFASGYHFGYTENNLFMNYFAKKH